jgi:hypothetical protein
VTNQAPSQAAVPILVTNESPAEPEPISEPKRAQLAAIQATQANNWLPVKHHSSKCNIMMRKMRRNKRSKSLPPKFNIDNLLDYLNCSMILNKHELRRLHHQQQHLRYNTATSNVTTNNSCSFASNLTGNTNFNENTNNNNNYRSTRHISYYRANNHQLSGFSNGKFFTTLYRR